MAETFGQAVWVKTLLDKRASMVAAYERAIALLQEGIERDWTREQFLAALDGRQNSMPIYAIRSTLLANQGLDKSPGHIKHVAQVLIAHFQKSFGLLRPQKPPEEVGGGS
jgi:hypothetical protein